MADETDEPTTKTTREERRARAEATRKRLLQEPELVLITDAAIVSARKNDKDAKDPLSDVEADAFDLPLKIGPVYDIIRHPNTVTPLSVAFYGDWGAGKTSAMEWLESRLQAWNAHEIPEEERTKDKIKLHTAWFYPWKYQTKEDVWRGLVAEVILACLSQTEHDFEKRRKEALRFAQFIGKGFYSLLESVKLAPGIGGTKVTFSLPPTLKDHAKKYFTPEAAYLNEIEEAFKYWVNQSLGENQRLVVFIDDLDRCMPEVALQVLEALKLYLNIGDLIFVVGVDDKVVRSLVIGHYEKLNLNEDKAKQYLSKMFQVEVPISPSDRQITDYLDAILEDNETWQKIGSDTTPDERNPKDIFRDVIFNLGERSPREIKRLVNSSLMAGEGARVSSLAHTPGKVPPTREQGIQVFLVHWILDRNHGQRGHWAGREDAIRFFRAWRIIIQKNPGDNRVLNLTADQIKALRDNAGYFGQSKTSASELELETGGDAALARRQLSTIEIPDHFKPLTSDPLINRYLFLLADVELAALMDIEYPEEAIALASSGASGDSVSIIEAAVRRSLDKDEGELTAEDWTKVQTLDLEGEELSDIAPLARLFNLTSLNFSSTQVADIAPLAGLTELTDLNLNDTQVADIAPLARLINLTSLNFSSTQVADIAPLTGLTELTDLNLNGTEVADIAPIAGLTSLEILDLNGTQVADIAPIDGLTSLEHLNLNRTEVADIAPIAGLTSLEILDLNGTQVADIAPIAGLTSLEVLDLNGTQVADIAPLEILANLTFLMVGAGQFPREQMDALRTARPDLKIMEPNAEEAD